MTPHPLELARLLGVSVEEIRKNRIEILNEKIKDIPIEELVQYQYKKSLSKVPHTDKESKRDYRMKEVSYLNLKSLKSLVRASSIAFSASFFTEPFRSFLRSR